MRKWQLGAEAKDLPVVGPVHRQVELPRWHQWQRTCLPMLETGDRGLIPGSGRSPGGGNGNPLQCSCLENSVDRGASQSKDHGVSQSDTTELA